MRGRALSLITIVTLVFSLIIPINNADASTNNTTLNNDVLDIGTTLRYLENDEAYRTSLDAKILKSVEGINFDENLTATSSTTDSEFTFDGGTKYFLGYNNGGYYVKTYTLRSIGNNVEIWVANNLAFLDDRPTPVITQEQVDILRDEFDSNIYGVVTDFFGNPNTHTGENAYLPHLLGLPDDYYTSADGIDRKIILVDNIRDENYYDQTYPFYVAGFYSPSYETYFDRNIISLDTNKWEERLESTYFGTTAHELQHLIHDDNDDLEENWINEGMADFAEYLSGYGHPWRHINFFLEHPENSLVEWDDHYSATTGPETLADYGQAYLLQLYLNDQYGKDFIKALAQDTDHGIVSVDKLLNDFETGINFSELFRRFTIALAIDNVDPGEGIYNFNSIDLKINYETAAYFEKDGVPAWGANYKIIDDASKIQNITFDGVDFMPSPWIVANDPFNSDNKVLWGNNGHEIDNMLILEADLANVTSATLQFDNFIDIEEQWDFGLVQVSTDNGVTWISLNNENTRDDIVDEGYPAIKENLPGFTGYYDGWIKETFDLTPFTGQKILINFRFMTDWGYNDTGWFVDNVEIPEIDFLSDGSSFDGFKSFDELSGIYVEYVVTFINEKSLGVGNNTPNYQVLNIDPFNVTEADAITLKDFLSGGNNYMIIWYAAPVGKKGTVDYDYYIKYKSDFNKNK